MVKSITRIRHVLFSITVAAAVSACGAPAPTSPVADGPSLLDLLASLRPSEAEARGLVAAEGSRRAPVAADLALAPEGVTFTLVELTPMILRADGTLSPVAAGDGVNTLQAGDLVLLPYDFTYADATTSLSGQFTLRWQWDPSLYVFTAANPPVTFTFSGPTDGVTFAGHVYNGFLDMLEGGQFDNGQVAGAKVMVIDVDTSAVLSVVRSGIDGAFATDVVPGNRTYAIQIELDGYYPWRESFAAPASGSIEGIRASLMMIPDELLRTTVVYGVVKDLDGRPVGGIVVEIVDAVTGDAIGLGVQANYGGEYAIPSVPMSSDRQLAVRAERSGRASTAVITVADPNQPPAWTRVDLTFQNHAPSVACVASDGSTAANVLLAVAPGDLVTLSVVGADADGDAMSYFWQADGGSLQAGPGGTATFAVPMMEGSWQVAVYPVDEVMMVGTPCRFELATELSGAY